MRPVNRGDVPMHDGIPVVFHDYKEAREPLINRIGSYCSYCERRMDEAPDVEHVVPKNPHPELKFVWDNFLLACTNCNSIKGHQEIDLTKYFWPDRDNTFLIFTYQEGGVIGVNHELSSEERVRAENTLRLTGLKRMPNNDPEVKDLRWNHRRETWDIAVREYEKLKKADSPEYRDTIVNFAKAQGYWSIWMTVFKDDEDMRRCFINSFSGTCCSCFDEHTNPIIRKNKN